MPVYFLFVWNERITEVKFIGHIFVLIVGNIKLAEGVGKEMC